MEEETPKRYAVVCERWRTPSKPGRESAELLMRQIEAMGHCPNTHTIEED